MVAFALIRASPPCASTVRRREQQALAVRGGTAAMNQAAKAQEPSMEEILASIRRIIADDDAAKTPAKAEPAKPAPAPAPPPPAKAAAPAPAPAKAAAPAPARPAAPPRPAPAPPAPAPVVSGQDDIDAMFAA